MKTSIANSQYVTDLRFGATTVQPLHAMTNGIEKSWGLRAILLKYSYTHYIDLVMTLKVDQGHRQLRCVIGCDFE